jgi:hypothetical protein
MLVEVDEWLFRLNRYFDSLAVNERLRAVTSPGQCAARGAAVQISADWLVAGKQKRGRQSPHRKLSVVIVGFPMRVDQLVALSPGHASRRRTENGRQVST